MKQYFSDKREKISSYLRDYFSRNEAEFSAIHQIGSDLLKRLSAFCLEGKMLRGCLASLSYRLFKKTSETIMIPVGAALELLQSALLIHDDIMDRDTERRGKHSLHHQYALKARDSRLWDPDHTGESLGICAGDVAFFLAFEILSRCQIPDKLARTIFRLSAREMAYVGVAQMMDVYMGAEPEKPTIDDVLRLYAYKTGRYTFSLPLMAGGLAAEANPEVLSVLENLGIYLGTIFQIKDDELGLFGDAAATGKSVGSDIKEGKKTLYYLLLTSLPEGADKRNALKLFGNKGITINEIRFIRDILTTSGIPDKIAAILSTLEEQTYEELEKLNGVDSEAKEILSRFIEYNIQRRT